MTLNAASRAPRIASGLPSTMMDAPLTITWILEHMLRAHALREVVSREADGTLTRLTYADFAARVAQLAHALVELGVRPGDRVASFGWNTHRHLELYYAVPCIGAVLHTANIRLFPEQVCRMLNHAGDTFVFVDGTLAPAIARAVAVEPDPDRRFVIMGETAAELPNAYDYETLIAGRSRSYSWPELDERSAAVLCYTSGTTGDPKGVAFSHRSTVLLALGVSLGDQLDIRQRDVVMPIVPMFHVNAWGLPYAAPFVGAKLVLPGARVDAASLVDLLVSEAVTVSGAVPTVWLGICEELDRRALRLPSLDHVVIGGSTIPGALFDDLERRGIRVIHAWGMTEMSPMGTAAHVHPHLETAAPERIREARLTQGMFSPLVAWKLLDDGGATVPADGVSSGHLWVCGAAVTGRYFGEIRPDPATFADGWFATGDICTVDALGYLRVVDRAKDLVKSGGEWISSVELEQHLTMHPAVLEAVVVGVNHAHWLERPIACVVLRAGHEVAEASLRAWLAERVAKWWVPDRVFFVAELPRTGVGKYLKRALREQYRDVLL